MLFDDDDEVRSAPVSDDRQEVLEGLVESVGADDGERDHDGGGDDGEDPPWDSEKPRDEDLQVEGDPTSSFINQHDFVNALQPTSTHEYIVAAVFPTTLTANKTVTNPPNPFALDNISCSTYGTPPISAAVSQEAV